jgi:hypothetical protein
VRSPHRRSSKAFAFGADRISVDRLYAGRTIASDVQCGSKIEKMCEHAVIQILKESESADIARNLVVPKSLAS